MTESGSVDRLSSKVAERQSYQPFIILVLDRHTVWAAGAPREIVLNALTAISRVLDAYGARGFRGTRRELFRIKRVNCMDDGHSKTEPGVQNALEMNDETAVAEEFVRVCGVCRTERARHTPPFSFTRASKFLCPTLGTKQRKRKYKERENPLKHNRTSCGVAVKKSRWGKPGGQETEGSAK